MGVTRDNIDANIRDGVSMQIYPSTEHFNCIKKYNLKKMHWPMEFILFIIHALGKKKKKDIDYRIVFSST